MPANIALSFGSHPQRDVECHPINNQCQIGCDRVSIGDLANATSMQAAIII
jgi:hypothetical protein